MESIRLFWHVICMTLHKSPVSGAGMPAIFLQFGVTMSGTFLSRRNLRKLAYPVGIAMTLFQLYSPQGSEY